MMSDSSSVTPTHLVDNSSMQPQVKTAPEDEWSELDMKDVVPESYIVPGIEGQSSDGELSAIAQVHVDQTNNPMGYDVEDIELQEPSLLLPTINNDATSLSPSTQDWPGMQDFSVRVPPPVKSKDAQYSSKLNKLYINQNKSVQVMFKVRQSPDVHLDTTGLGVRAVAIYTRHDDSQTPVAVCYTHSHDSVGNLKHPNAEHLIICTSPNSSYDIDENSKRHSVVSMVPQPSPGSSEIPIYYKFMDLGSCPGGLNRRDTAIIFTLEHFGLIIGRRVLPLRICTCPKRDMETEEKQEKKNICTAQPGKIKMDGKKDKHEQYWVLARGRKNYEALKKVGRVLDEHAFSEDPTEYDAIVDRKNEDNLHAKRKRKFKEEST